MPFYCIHHSTTNVNAQNVGRKMSQWHAMAPPTGHSPRICRWWIYSLPSMVNKFPIWAEAAAAAAWSSDKNKRNRRKQKTVGNRFWWLLKPRISSVTGDEGSYLPNCHNKLDIVWSIFKLKNTPAWAMVVVKLSVCLTYTPMIRVPILLKTVKFSAWKTKINKKRLGSAHF